MSERNVLKAPRIEYAAFIDYIPAELRTNQDWLIVFYVKNPLSLKLDRKRIRVPKHKSKSERQKLAAKMCLDINARLAKGESFLKAGAKEYAGFRQSVDLYLKYLKQEVEKGEVRPDTYRSYRSILEMVFLYQKESGQQLQYMAQFNQPWLLKFLDWSYYDRGNSGSTYNNYLRFLNTFANFCIARNMLKENPATSIPRKRKTKKKRVVFSTVVKEHLRIFLPEFDFGYYALCMMDYYCMFRRTEITKLKVSDVRLAQGYVSISGESSKNKKDEFVTIPDRMVAILAEHLSGAVHSDWYLFGADFKPGPVQLKPKKISDTWSKIRIALNLPAEYQWYSFKDTGITDLLNTGISAIKVRDQARHYDLSITESYTDRNRSSDHVVKNAGFEF